MDDKQRDFFMMTVEIRILMAVVSRISARSIHERFGAYNADMSGLQFGILRSLTHESSTLSELSRKFVLDPSTLVPVIDTLERKGLVERGKDPNDRRRIPLSLTEEGVKLMSSVPLFHEDDVLYQCLTDMGKRRTHGLLRLLREVVERLPEGEEILEGVESRLYTLEPGKNVTYSPDCSIQHRENADIEHDHMKRRSMRRRIRRRNT